MTQGAFYGIEGHMARQIICILVILDWLPFSPQNVWVFFQLSSTCFLLMICKSWKQNDGTDSERSFCKAFDGICQKGILLVLEKECGTAKSASLFNGKFSYFAKPAIDACS